MMSSTALQQLVVYAVFGLLLDAAGIDYTHALYWCALALMVVSNHLSRKEGFTDGLEAADDTLTIANKILEEAKKYVDEHSAKIAVEKQELIDKLTALTKAKDTQ